MYSDEQIAQARAGITVATLAHVRLERAPNFSHPGVTGYRIRYKSYILHTTIAHDKKGWIAEDAHRRSKSDALLVALRADAPTILYVDTWA